MTTQVIHRRLSVCPDDVVSHTAVTTQVVHRRLSVCSSDVVNHAAVTTQVIHRRLSVCPNDVVSHAAMTTQVIHRRLSALVMWSKTHCSHNINRLPACPNNMVNFTLLHNSILCSLFSLQRAVLQASYNLLLSDLYHIENYVTVRGCAAEKQKTKTWTNKQALSFESPTGISHIQLGQCSCCSGYRGQPQPAQP